MLIKDNEVADISTPTGDMRAHIFRPAAPGKYPGILMFSEIFQVTGPIRRTAAMLAGHGFIVACPEIYHELETPGTVLSYDEEGTTRGNAHKITKELSSYDTDARAVLDYLKSRDDCTGRLGVMGICIGGHLAFRAAMNPDVLATTCFYATDIHKKGLGLGKKLIKRYDLTKPQGVRGRNSDNALLRQVLGWEPEISLEDGLRLTYFWILEQIRKS